jgi:hypothetical protein
MTHPYKDILIAIANGEQIQWHGADGIWYDQTHEGALQKIALSDYDPERYRVKPRTLRINGHEVPEPVREPLKDGQACFLVEPTSTEGAIKFTWKGVDSDRAWLEHGLIHLTEEAAKTATDAVLSLFRRGEA